MYHYLPPEINTPEFVAAIKSQDPAAEAELYNIVWGMRWTTFRTISDEERPDVIHDAFIGILRSLRAGALDKPASLFSYIRTVLMREAAHCLKRRLREKLDQGMRVLASGKEVEMDEYLTDERIDTQPHETLAQAERLAQLRRALDSMTTRDRDILERFYLLEQPRQQIEAEMRLTPTQFRLYKSRAKEEFETILSYLIENGELPERGSIRTLMLMRRLRSSSKSIREIDDSPEPTPIAENPMVLLQQWQTEQVRRAAA